MRFSATPFNRPPIVVLVFGALGAGSMFSFPARPSSADLPAGVEAEPRGVALIVHGRKEAIKFSMTREFLM